MQLQSAYTKRVFHFNFDAHTSRGRMSAKTSWFIKLWNNSTPDVFGVGEAGPLPGLSPDDRTEFEDVLRDCLLKIGSDITTLNPLHRIVPPGFPSLRFAMETALMDLRNGGRRLIFNNTFVHGTPISINGLVWMGDMDSMLQQISSRIGSGFRCIKLKVGSLDFETECDVIRYIRSKYFRENITIRLDANGAFKPDEALHKLNRLAQFDIHSIEQPIKPGLPEMEHLCARSPIPVALDEELIGVELPESKRQLLRTIKPRYIILKPTLHGGFASCGEWISTAEELGIGWWLTSALESNIGLNAICQFAANYPINLPQGLGTGQLYEDNIDSPLTVSAGEIAYRPEKVWHIDGLFA